MRLPPVTTPTTSPAARAACLAALAALEAGETARAEEILSGPLAAEPSDPNLLYLWGNCALVRGDDAAALDRYARALAVVPDFPAVLLNVGFVHRRHHRLAAARAALERCIALVPADEAAWINLVSTYVNEGEPAVGEAVARRALEHHPSSALVRWNLALVLLEQGRWEEGWREWVHRFPAGVVAARDFGQGPAPPRLAGIADLRPGQVVVCHGEQGIGDEILFAGMLSEFAAAVAARGATLLLDAAPRLRAPFERSFGLETWPRDAAGRGVGPRPDWIVAIGDLGGFFRRRAADFPDRGGYLATDADRVRAIRGGLTSRGGGRGPLVGLAWTGGSAHTHARFRCVALEEWLPLLRLPATFVVLEYRDRSAEVAALAAEHGVEMILVPELAGSGEYDDVLHLVAALDHVVTVPTSVLHAAGAVGTPCTVVMHRRAAWRECSADDRIPWYPRTHRRIVRGADEAGWERAVVEVAAEVAGTGRSPSGA